MRRRSLLKLLAGGGAVAGLGIYRPSLYEWRGYGFGGDISIAVRDPQSRFPEVERDILKTIDQLEDEFSLFRPHSTLSRLNRDKMLQAPSPAFLELMNQSADIWRATDGRFDPTVQNLWRFGHGHTGFENVEMSAAMIRIHDPEISLTLNGIAQGYASDVIAERLERYGFDEYLVNMGEYASGKGVWHLEIQDGAGIVRSHIVLENGGISTSAPQAMKTPNGASHIIDPHGKAAPIWDMVTVQAKTAAIADGLSTALSLMSIGDIRGTDFAARGVSKIWLWGGDETRVITT